MDKDGNTCERCADTGDTVRGVFEDISRELHPAGWEVTFKETLLTEKDITESNVILLNGVPIEEIIPNARKSKNCCASCGELLGAPAMCRTIEHNGQTYEAIPTSLIQEAVYQFINEIPRSKPRGIRPAKK